MRFTREAKHFRYNLFMFQPKIIIVQHEAEFCGRGVEILQSSMSASIIERGKVVIGLSGGSTPRAIYEVLGKEKLDWSKVWVFLVDDRYINADDPKSNQFLLRSTLLKNAPIPESQIIFPDTTLPYEDCIRSYEVQLRSLLKTPADLVTLGLGDDGHIASLFPPVLDDAFGDHLVIGTETEQFDVRQRISVTMPVLQAAREIVFFLKGEVKKKTWKEMMTSKDGPNRWPARALKNPVVIAQW